MTRKRMAFDLESTDGFSQDQIDILNSAVRIIQKSHPGLDETTINDLVNNAWVGDESAEELAQRATQGL
jgi:hypothetical protein